MIRITDKQDCCGCTACASVCPYDAITMQPDGLGFLYPVVDDSKCVDCHLCEKVCAFNDKYDTSLNLLLPEAYGARHKEIKEIELSRSGAAFVVLSDWILEHGGIVYGAGYKDHFRVAHKRATSKKDRDEFRGSKYVQSDLTGIFKSIKKDLKAGLIVLFSGTPCQTAGLNSYINKNLRENLYLVDIVCHGVPSPFIWRDYINFLEKKHHSEIISVNFRDKSALGWRAHRESFIFKNGNAEIRDNYTFIFYKHIMFRQSCSVCHYANIRRPSDITLADFWGWEKTDPTFNADDKGASLLLINTEKGRSLFEKVHDKMDIISVRLEDCMQANLCHPSTMHPKRMNFEKVYTHKGIEYVMKRYGNIGFTYTFQQLFMLIINKIRFIFFK